MNIFFLIFMAPIYSVDNVYLSVAWTILGLANGVYLIVKQRYGNTNKRIWRTDKKEPKYRFFFILSIFDKVRIIV